MTLHYTTATIDGMDLSIAFSANGGEVFPLEVVNEGAPCMAFASIDCNPGVEAACREYLRIKALADREWALHDAPPLTIDQHRDALRMERERGLGED